MVEALLERTEALCGFPPSDEQAAVFLRGQASSDAHRPVVTHPRPAGRGAVRPSPVNPVPRGVDHGSSAPPPDRASAARHGWRVGAASGSAHKGVKAFLAFLDAIFAQHPERRQQMIAAARTRSRNNIAVALDDVYSRQPQLARRAHRKLANGLFVGTNLSNPNKVQMARQLARAADLAYCSDVVLDLAE